MLAVSLSVIRPARATTKRLDQKVDSVLNLMTLDEKIGQLVLYTSNWDVTGPVMGTDNLKAIREGKCGNIFNAYTAKYTRELQEIAVKESRLGIPLLFGYDVIHGHKTIFPISLGEAASWDLAAIEKSARVSAKEAAAMGIQWTYAPMVDIARDPRWGRISEGAGEDPFLGCAIAKARVHGFQGDDLADPTTVLACVKHFAAYGAPIAGRDYNTVDMSERMLREVYLPPYKAAIDAGALSVMTSFNELDGVPATASHFLMTEVLRNEWKFKGFVVTDYTAINELVPHGVAANLKDAAMLAMNAGVDMDMQGGAYNDYLKELVKERKVSEEQIDTAVCRVLKLKFMLGLFDDPYRYCNEKREKETIYAKENLDAAYDVACKSMVLLKNNKEVLPLKAGQSIALIGPLADSRRDLLGSWKAAGDWDQISSVYSALKKANQGVRVTYSKGCELTGGDTSMFAEALVNAKKADVVVMVLGESCEWCGEAASRTSISVPDIQKKLLHEVSTLGKPVVLVLMNGRPLALVDEYEWSDAMLEAWFPGTMGAEAVADVLLGKYNPSGKLPVTFPRNIGQVPIYYSAKNTGRPYEPDGPEQKYRSRYIDSSNQPLFPFGFGLSYTSFAYKNMRLGKSTITGNDSLEVSVDVTNTGKYPGDEVVQLYIRDLVGSVTRPVKELKGFKKISLDKGETKKVSFWIRTNDLAFYRKDMSFGTEPGKFIVFVGGSSDAENSKEFSLTE